MTDHLLDWLLYGLAIGLSIGLLGAIGIASGFDWLQWFAAATFVGLVVGAGVGLATLRDRPTCERYAEDDEYEMGWGER